MTHSYLKFKLYYFPMLTAVWYTVTYLLVYTMAVLEGHVNPIFPFISAAGTTPPESCIFGFMLNIGAVLMFIVIYVRYQYIRYSNEVDVPKRLNNFTYFLGMSASFGVILVANFQETNLLPVHVLGASCAFGSSVIYCCIQTWITWKSTASKCLKNCRLVISTVLIPTFFTNLFFIGLSLHKFKGVDRFKWKLEDGGYSFHLAATFSEWITALSLNIYIFTFASDFKDIRFEGVVFTKDVELKL